ncbi:hypothetical protein WMY93_001633 [Mugilogobius chulae]|uniref:Carbonic anhydrase n=1 Tax=Mugilogobius chulae TaxID=88201 RepID=A0AAW0Q268_9GOBI
MFWLAIALLCLVPAVQGATSDFAWCYHNTSCNDATWATNAPSYCNGSRQSPINIDSTKATLDSNLKTFTFTKFDSKTALVKMENTGNTSKTYLWIKLSSDVGSGVTVSGGGLSEAYTVLQFHLHWGNMASTPGSEHTVDGTRYPMELHIVSIKSSYNQNVTAALKDSEGVAAFGFLIDVDTSTTGQPASWKTLTTLLSQITQKGQAIDPLSVSVSVDDLVPANNLKSFYRYLGSLTTPNCEEAVVWTVFKQPVKVSKDLIDLFSTTVRVGDASSPYMMNTYRNIQPALTVTHNSSPKTSLSFGLLLLALALWMS